MPFYHQEHHSGIQDTYYLLVMDRSTAVRITIRIRNSTTVPVGSEYGENPNPMELRKLPRRRRDGKKRTGTSASATSRGNHPSHPNPTAIPYSFPFIGAPEVQQSSLRCQYSKYSQRAEFSNAVLDLQ